MHKFSRTLLLAGVLAFGTLSAACGDKVEIAGPATGVQLVTVTPPNASIQVGESIVLSGQVTADAASAKTVTWSTSSAPTATVDANGKVTGVKAGTASITATATADPTKAASSVVTVTAGPTVVVPTIGINGVTQGGVAVNLGNTAGQIDVAVNTSGGGLIEAFLSSNCTSNTIAATDVAVASQTATSAQAGTITLSFNTAQLTAAGAPRFPNGAYCIKTRLTNGTQVVVATNTVPVTLNNLNTVTATLAFVTQNPGAPISAVSSINGLNYNQGTLTATITPVIFTSSSPAALLSGSFTLNGELNGAGATDIAFTNVPVTGGKATIVLTDTSLAGVNSIFRYTSTKDGDTLYVTSATDAAGNAISVGTGVAAAGAQGVRIDNDVPLLGTSTYAVTAPNGYIAGIYAFASGIVNGSTVTDTKGGIPGVGGVTTTWYVGLATAAAFTSTDACNTSGLTAAATGTDLPNTTSTNVDKARVIVADKLGNKVCFDVASTFAGGLFGVDKIPPTVALTAGTTAQTAGTDAKDSTGYNVSKNYTFVYSDTISGFDPSFPVKGTLTKNFFTTGSDSSQNCLIGTYTAGKACTAIPMAGVIEFTNGTLLQGYYTVTANAVDRAGNPSATVTRIAAYDPTAPAAAAPTLAASVAVTGAALGTASVSSALTDNFDLASATGRLIYPAAATFAGVASNSLGTTFDPVFVKTATATVALPNVYLALQTTTAGAINGTVITPTATVTATDVGRNSTASTPVGITTTTTAAAVLQTSNTLNLAATNLAPATTQSSTVLTVTVGGLVSDAAFQSQPFQQVDIYKVNSSGELVFVTSLTAIPSVTDVGTARTYTWTSGAVALTAAATNTFVVIGRTANGQGVISGQVAIVNP
jgi:hypothetical protein